MSIQININFNTIKTFGVVFAPFLVPRVIRFIQSLRTSSKTRPNPQPLPAEAARALNILFFSAALFLVLSLPLNPYSPSANIFDLTSSRLKIPTDLLFSRLAQHRPDGTLTPQDELLRSQLSNVTGRTIYLRFGEDGLLNCPFCDMDTPLSYMLYYLPFNTMMPHLFHLFIIGLATSAPLVGREASRWRKFFVFASLCLAGLEVIMVAIYDPTVHGPAARNRLAIPRLLHNRLFYARLIVFCLFDIASAGLVYLSATNRMFYTPPTPSERAEQMLKSILNTVASTTPKLHALHVVKNAVTRDEELRKADGLYWQSLREKEKELDDVWREPEVARALKKVSAKQQDGPPRAQSPDGNGQGEGADSTAFVDYLTTRLEQEDDVDEDE